MATSRDLTFGELTLRFTTDGRSCPDGWYRLAPASSLEGWFILVRSTDPAKEMVKPVTQWEYLGSHGLMNSSRAYRAVPPAGYKALSDVSVLVGSKPDDPKFGCIKEAKVGSFSYVHKSDVSGIGQIWTTVAPEYWYGDNGLRLAPSSYGGMVFSHDSKRPVDLPAMHVLNLPITTVPGPAPKEPQMDSYDKPVDATGWAKSRAIRVPFVGIKDERGGRDWQIANSPTYTLERYARYFLQKYSNNKLGGSPARTGYSVTSGISKSQTDTWHVKFGVSYGGKGGLDMGLIKGETSWNVSIEAGYSSARNVTEMESRTDFGDLVVPPKHSGAVYTIEHQLKIIREDGTPVAGEGGGMGFTPYTSHHFVQYPKPSRSEDSVQSLSEAARTEIQVKPFLVE